MRQLLHSVVLRFGIFGCATSLAMSLAMSQPALAQNTRTGASAASNAQGSGTSSASSSTQGSAVATPSVGPEQIYGLRAVASPPVLGLQQVLDAVAKSNPDLRSAREAMIKQELQARKAWAGLLPQISLSGSYSYNFPEQKVDFFDAAQSQQQALMYRSQADMVERSASLEPDADKRQQILAQAAALRAVADQLENAKSEPIVISPTHQFGAQLQMVVPLLSANAIPNIYNAHDAVSLLEHGQDQSKAALVFVATRTYYGAVAAKRTIDSAQRQLAGAQAHFDNVKHRAELGEVTPLSLQRAELDAIRAEQQLRLAHTLLASTLGSLGQLMDRDNMFDIEVPSAVPALEASADEQQFVQRAMLSRPDVVIKKLQLGLAERQKVQAWMAFLPSVNLVATGNYTSNTSGFSSEPYSGAIALQASIPLFQGGTRWVGLDEAAAEYRRAAFDLEQLEHSITRQVRGNLSEITSKRELVVMAQHNLELATATLGNTEQLFALNEVTPLDVSDSRLAAFAAEVDLTRAELDLEQARLGLAYVLGELRPVEGKTAKPI